MYISTLNIHKLDASLQKLASSFKCGNDFIDSFLKSSVALDKGFGVTYVWLDDENSSIIGFYNITSGSIEQADQSGNGYKMGGAIHLNEFAIHQNFRGKTIPDDDSLRMSDLLLHDCIARVQYLRDNLVGFSFITLHSTNDGYSLYQRHGFCDIEEDMTIAVVEGKEDDCFPMYLALDLEDM